MVFPGTLIDLFGIKSTSRPTIMLASSPWLVDGEAIPTTLPNLIMVILSATSLTSLNLWVMKMIDVPFAFKVLIIFKSSSVS